MRPTRRSTPAILALILLTALPAGAQPPHAAPADRRADVTAEDWRADFRLLVRELEDVHPDPWFHVDRETFVAEVEKARSRADAMSWEESYAQLHRLLAMLRDGHTGVAHHGNENVVLRRVQVMFREFPEGVFVIRVHPDHAEILGGRVTRVGNASVEEAIRRISPLASADNDYTELDRRARLLTSAELLKGVGLIEDLGSCELEVEKDGRRIKARVPTDGMHDESAWPEVLRAAGTPAPLYLSRPGESYFLELLPEHDAAYLLFRRVRNDEDRTFEEFCREAFRTLEQKGVDRLIVDVRLNGGGNNYLNRPLIHGILRNDRVNRPGHLFVITGRTTFSAAMCCTIDLERQTEAMFVGEPTGATPNHHGDAVPVVLPRTGLTVNISALVWQNSDPRDRRPWVEPDLPAVVSWEDYLRGHDPALTAALEYAPFDGEVENVAPTLIARLDEGATASAVLRRFEELRASTEGRAYHLNHWQLNAVGYELLGRGRTEEAFAVFRRNTELFPWEWNPWDSLGEALAGAGRTEEAIAAYRRSVELNPANRGGQAALRGLERGA